MNTLYQDVALVYVSGTQCGGCLQTKAKIDVCWLLSRNCSHYVGYGSDRRKIKDVVEFIGSLIIYVMMFYYLILAILQSEYYHIEHYLSKREAQKWDVDNIWD